MRSSLLLVLLLLAFFPHHSTSLLGIGASKYSRVTHQHCRLQIYTPSCIRRLQASVEHVSGVDDLPSTATDCCPPPSVVSMDTGESVFSFTHHETESHNALQTKGKAPQGWNVDGLRCILGGILTHLTLGTIYCWGNFLSYAPPNLKYFRPNLTPQALNSPPDALCIIPITFLAQTIMMPFANQFFRRLGVKQTLLFGK